MNFWLKIAINNLDSIPSTCIFLMCDLGSQFLFTHAQSYTGTSQKNVTFYEHMFLWGDK